MCRLGTFLTLFKNFVNSSRLGTRLELIAKRMSERAGHFMPVSLLDSQFASMEAPLNEPDMIMVSIDDTVPQIVANATQIASNFLKQ